MSEDIRQKTVISMLIIAMVISMGGTIVVLTKLSNISFQQQLTGLASDSGTAKINITSVLGITVDPDNNIINFGTCIPPTSGVATINSKMNESYLNSSTTINCSGTHGGRDGATTPFPANITIQNTGNVEANITIQTNATGENILGPGAHVIFVTANNNSVAAGCIGDLEESWVALENTATEYELCSSLNYGSSSPAIDVSIQLNISSIASTGTNQATAGLEFWANGI